MWLFVRLVAFFLYGQRSVAALPSISVGLRFCERNPDVVLQPELRLLGRLSGGRAICICIVVIDDVLYHKISTTTRCCLRSCLIGSRSAGAYPYVTG